MDIERSIKCMRKEKFKMRQTRNFFIYIAVPLLTLFKGVTGNFFLNQTVRLVNGLRAIGGFSCQEVDPTNIGIARVEFKSFLQIMCKTEFYGIEYPTYKNHLVRIFYPVL